MREKDARRLLLCLLGLAVVSTWWNAMTLSRVPPSPLQASLESGKNTSLDTQVFHNASTDHKAPAQTSSKPYFVLHIGPPKTATTTIQCGLDHMSADLAGQDHYYFVGKRCPPMKDQPLMDNGESAIHGHHLMMGLINANPKTRGYDLLDTRMKYHKQHGNHMVYSIEAMSNHLDNKTDTWNLFLSLFQGWNVRVVVAYRHYFDWIRSMYFQQHLGNKYKKKWPHEKGLIHPSFREYLSYHLERWETGEVSNDGHSFGQHLTLFAFEYFSEHFEDVQVFDLHQGGDVFTNFVCQMLPLAGETCKRLEDSALDTGVKRESHSFDAERLAGAAYALDLVNRTVLRVDVVEQVSRRLKSEKTMFNKSNVACLSKETEKKFLNASLWFEQKIFGSKHHTIPRPRDEQHTKKHIDLFQQAIQTGKFCEVDTEQVLKDERWRNFFRNIKGKIARVG